MFGSNDFEIVENEWISRNIQKNKYIFKRRVKGTESRTRMFGESTESLRLLLSSTLANFKLNDIFCSI